MQARPDAPRAARSAAPARQQSLRDHNLGLVLRLVAGAVGPLSRARIAETTGLTRATASTLVEVLIEGGLLVETDTLRTRRSGRPATGLSLAGGGPGGLGLEVNVDYVAVTVVDLAGRSVLHDVRRGDQRATAPATVLAAAARLAAGAVRTAAARGIQVAGAAVALPGLLRDGRVLVAPNLGWDDVAAASVLRRNRTLAALPLTLGNEANYAALSQVTDERASFLHVSGEIGIGAAAVFHGELARGVHGWGGELGHMTYRPDGPRCPCGSRGCLEQYAGQEAVSRAAGLGAVAGTVLGGADSALVLAARRGDRGALAALDQAGTALGTVLAGALNLLDLRTVYLGGFFEAVAPWLLPNLERELGERVLWSRIEPPVVAAATHGPAAAALGAARSVVREILAEPDRWLAR